MVGPPKNTLILDLLSSIRSGTVQKSNPKKHTLAVSSTYWGKKKEKKKQQHVHTHTDTMCFTAKHFTSITINKTEHKISSLAKFSTVQSSINYVHETYHNYFNSFICTRVQSNIHS